MDSRSILPCMEQILTVGMWYLARDLRCQARAGNLNSVPSLFGIPWNFEFAHFTSWSAHMQWTPSNESDQVNAFHVENRDGNTHMPHLKSHQRNIISINKFPEIRTSVKLWCVIRELDEHCCYLLCQQRIIDSPEKPEGRKRDLRQCHTNLRKAYAPHFDLAHAAFLTWREKTHSQTDITYSEKVTTSPKTGGVPTRVAQPLSSCWESLLNS